MNIKELEERFKAINEYIENDTVFVMLEEIITDLEAEEGMEHIGGSIGTIINMSNGQSYFVADTKDQVESRLGL